MLKILLEADIKCLEKLVEKRKQKRWEIDSQIKEADKKIFRNLTKRSTKRYNITQTAKILGVHRGSLYYWIKKKRIKPKRDYRSYPVFTVLDIESLIRWKNTIK